MLKAKSIDIVCQMAVVSRLKTLHTSRRMGQSRVIRPGEGGVTGVGVWLGMGLLEKAVKTQRFFYILALNDMLAKYDLKSMYMELLGPGRCKGENPEVLYKGECRFTRMIGKPKTIS